MKVITLLTDFGSKDPYVGIMKGVILALSKDLGVEVSIVDIVHDIDPQDIKEAAFVIREYYRFFPEGTIHVAVVDPGVGTERRPIIVSKGNQLFVGPDNGIFTLVLEEDFEVYEIKNTDFMLKNISSTFHGRDIFAPCAVYLAKGFHPSAFGERVRNPVLDESLFPDIVNDVLIGQIVRFDRFGNAISNIAYDLFRDFTSGQNFRIIIRDKIFTKIVRTYQESEIGVIVGSSGLLEFAAFKRSFREDFGIKKGEEVRVELIP